MKTLRITYQLLMLIFSPITFGFAIPIAFNIFLNKWVYGEFPRSLDYDVYGNWVSNPATLIILIVSYCIIWFSIKNFFKKRNLDIL